jgi:hypothetical protein
MLLPAGRRTAGLTVARMLDKLGEHGLVWLTGTGFETTGEVDLWNR